MSQNLQTLSVNTELKFSTAFIRSQVNLKLQEQRVMICALAVYNPFSTDENSPPDKIYIPTVANIVGLTTSAFRREVDKITDDLLKKIIKFKTKQGWAKYPIFTYIELQENNLWFKFNNELRPFLSDFKAAITCTLGDVLKFKRQYSWRLLILLYSEHILNKSFSMELSIDEIREYFLLEDDEYSDDRNMVRSVIHNAVEEINKFSRYNVTFEKIKQKGKSGPARLSGVKIMWSIKPLDEYIPNDKDVEAALTERGVSPKEADKLSKEFDYQYIQKKISHYDRIKDSLHNPGGFLADSIRKDFAVPENQSSVPANVISLFPNEPPVCETVYDHSIDSNSPFVSEIFSKMPFFKEKTASTEKI